MDDDTFLRAIFHHYFSVKIDSWCMVKRCIAPPARFTGYYDKYGKSVADNNLRPRVAFCKPLVNNTLFIRFYSIDDATRVRSVYNRNCKLHVCAAQIGNELWLPLHEVPRVQLHQLGFNPDYAGHFAAWRRIKQHCDQTLVNMSCEDVIVNEIRRRTNDFERSIYKSYQRRTNSQLLAIFAIDIAYM